MRALTFYMLLIFVTTLGLGAWVNDFTARQCVATTGKTYQECNQ